MKKNGVLKTKLKNGLTVLLKEVHTAPVVSTWVWYRVGSRHERAGVTGISHWLEHMMFKGTPRFAGDVVERRIARDGGVFNAMTWIDWTTYYETMPSDKIDYVLRMEADRMRHTRFVQKEVDHERTVVIAERQGHENNPSFRLAEEVQAAAFRVHPYHHEVIGDMADLSAMTRDDLEAHYRQYYAPNNAIVAVGDFKTSAMLARIQQLFGGYARQTLTVPRARPEPEQRGERRVTLTGEGETAYLEAVYHVPNATHADFYPLVALDSILGGGGSLNPFGSGTSNKSSRLYKALVETNLAAGVAGSLNPTVDPYVYSIFAVARAGKTPAEVEQALDAEISRMQQTPVSPADLAKAIKPARAFFAYDTESVTRQGCWLGITEIFGTYEWFEQHLERLEVVTPEDVQRVAQKYLLKTNRTVGHFIPTAPARPAGPD
jgi:zinc protease